MTLLGATTPDQSRPGSDDNEGVLHLPQRCSITGDSLSDFFLVISSAFIVGRDLPLYGDAVGVFYSPSQLGCT